MILTGDAVLVILCPPQIPRGMVWDRNLASAARGRRKNTGKIEACEVAMTCEDVSCFGRALCYRTAAYLQSTCFCYSRGMMGRSVFVRFQAKFT